MEGDEEKKRRQGGGGGNKGGEKERERKGKYGNMAQSAPFVVATPLKKIVEPVAARVRF